MKGFRNLLEEDIFYKSCFDDILQSVVFEMVGFGKDVSVSTNQIDVVLFKRKVMT